MSTKVDKLFKDKLEGHTLQPSAQAWEKVEAHIGKKNKMALMLRVAAAVMLLGVLTFVGINWKDGAKQEVASNQKPEVRDQKPEVRSQEPELKESTQPVVVKKEIKKQKTQPQPKKVIEPVEQVAVVEEIQEPITNTQQPITNTQPPVTNVQQPKKGITLTYSLPAVKKDEPIVADVEVKKTGLERVLEIAREVKNGDPLGELREAKNDILALEFRKDKNKKH